MECPSREPSHWSGSRAGLASTTEDARLAIYTRHVSCAKGHAIELCFEWNAERTGGQSEYSKSCPAAGCGAQVTGKLPVGADPETLELRASSARPQG